MPFYNVEHSFPLTLQQKTQLAERITQLHAKTFTTPSIFVQVKFYQQDASAYNHFIGGEHSDSASNRIIAYVRSSSERKKEHFDKLGEQIEHAWYVVVGEKFEGVDDDDVERQKKDAKESTKKEKDAKELLSIGFVGGLVVREKGFVISDAGQEEAWINENRKEIERRAELGDVTLKKMLEEIESRDDLKTWRA